MIVLNLFSKLVIISAVCLCLTACHSEHSLEFDRYYAQGLYIYQAHCQNCHGKKGEGIASLIPPLTDSTFLKNNQEKLPCIIKYGIASPISINGRTYEFTMPPQNTLSDIELAEVIVYINNSFGNHIGMYTLEKIRKNKCL